LNLFFQKTAIMQFTFQRIIIIFITLVFSVSVKAQSKSISKTDTTSKPSTPPASQGPKPYKDVITAKAVSDGGLFWVHKVEEKYFIEIPDTLFGREILVVNRISKAAADMRMGGFFGYAGDQIGQNVIRFEKGPNNKVFIRTLSFAEYSKDSTSPMFTAVRNSNVQPIVSSFDIKALGKDSTGAVIDITEFVNGDNDVLYFNSNFKSALRIGGLQPDKSYIVAVRSYPINLEIKTVKTYSRSGGGPGSPAGSGNMTMELNSSMVLLPKTPMKGRYFDPRVGFFSVGYTDYDENPQGVKKISLIKRWRLEPKDEDIDKYKRGELVVPKKPILFYIDPATPAKWVPYIIQGVNDWQKTFEKAGFMNAIMAKKAPTKEEDSTWSLEDATTSAIVYKPSDIPNASGPSIADPRSGEIMESHVNWYHNVMSLIHDWYMVQAAPNDPRARKMVFDDELMGQLIRFVSSHEIGHTLGLRHNYGSSSTVPVENLRNKAWVEANGHTPSIMDYARFNYVAQPEDSISEKGIFPRIGDYDNWAIEWGYRDFQQFKTPLEEKPYLNKWVIEKLKNKRLWFGTELNPDDPRSQSEQVGDDAMKGSMYGIKNLQRIVPNLSAWTKLPDEDYSELKDMYGQVSTQFTRYLAHVAKYIGGIMETPKMIEEEGPVYEIVPVQKQKEAVDFLNKQLFATPAWLINQDIFSRTGGSGLTVIGGIQDNMLNRIMSIRTMNKLIDAEASLGNKAFQITDLLADLKKGIWNELPTRKPIDIYRRNLQKSYVNVLANILNPAAQTTEISSSISFTMVANNDKSDATSVVRAHLAALRTEAIAAANGTTDPMTKYHLQDIVKRIEHILDPKN
jgi:Met-zincin/Domain of unknown function (DUF5117)/Domain of unknown function (DUF5118)